MYSMRVVRMSLLLVFLLAAVSMAVPMGCGSKLDGFAPCMPGYTIWVCQVHLTGGGLCGCGKNIVQPTCATSLSQAETNVFNYLMQDYPGASQFSFGCQNTGSRYPQSVDPPIKVQGTSGAGGDSFGAGGDPFGAGGDPFGAGGDAACTCNAGGGSPGAGGSFGDGGGFAATDVGAGAGTSAAD